MGNLNISVRITVLHSSEQLRCVEILRFELVTRVCNVSAVLIKLDLIFFFFDREFILSLVLLYVQFQKLLYLRIFCNCLVNVKLLKTLGCNESGSKCYLGLTFIIFVEDVSYRCTSESRAKWLIRRGFTVCCLIVINTYCMRLRITGGDGSVELHTLVCIAFNSSIAKLTPCLQFCLINFGASVLYVSVRRHTQKL